MNMATSGVKELSYSVSLGSEDLCEVVCDPCQEDGGLHKAVGMCVDCQDHLCQRCFDGHRIGRAYRRHKLLNKDDMLQSQVFTRKDKCTEKCDVHEDEVIKYYCKDHCKLGCSACITINHRSCENVTYIPVAAKDLHNNEEYNKAECYLNSVNVRNTQFTEEFKQQIVSFDTDCSQTVKTVHEFRIQLNEALNKIEAGLVGECEQLKSAAAVKIAQIDSMSKRTRADLEALMTMKDTYQDNNQNSNLYIFMIKANDTLKVADNRITEAEKEQSSFKSQIKFESNRETLDKLKSPESFGKMLAVGIPSVLRPEETRTIVRQRETRTTETRREMGTIVRAEHIRDINVESNSDNRTCSITGLIVLPANRIVITDQSNCFRPSGNGSVKLLSAKHYKVITHLTLSSGPFDIAMINNGQVAVTIPNENKVEIINVTSTVMTTDRKLGVDNQCWGVDYRDDRLAVSFINPDKVQVLTLQGIVLHNIPTEQKGHSLFCQPLYVVFGRDSTSLFVSNSYRNDVMHVKVDGTVLGAYTDSQLQYPAALVTGSSDSLYICGASSCSLHRITKDCKKYQVSLTIGSNSLPYSIGYSESEDMIYVGMLNDNVVKVYRGYHQ